MAEPTEAPQGGAEPVAPSRPDYLDARFTSVEEQAKAYKEAETKMQQESGKRAELERQNRELLARQTPTLPIASPQPEPDLNELYWQKPAEVMEKLVQKHVEPFYEDKYEAQKQMLLTKDPAYAKYFPQIDAMVKAQPGLKKQPGIVEKLYKVASALEFDPDAERKRIEERVRNEMQMKIGTSLEGVGSPPTGTPSSLPELSSDEKRVAEKFHRDLSPQEAHKKYAESKLKWAQGA